MSQNIHLKKTPLLIEPHYFGSIHYYARWLFHEKLIPEIHENYAKGSYRNRLYISGPNGPILLSIPLQKGKNEQMPLNEVRISYSEDWRHRHWQAIRSSYNRSPFFEYISDDIRALYQQRFEFLIELTFASSKLIQNLFKSLQVLAPTESYNREVLDCMDMRNHIHPKESKGRPDHLYRQPVYHQVFQEKTGFFEALSILDLYVMEGPNCINLLKKAMKKNNPL